MKRTLASIIILALVGVLLAPAGTALAATGGSFRILNSWVWTDSGVPQISLSLAPAAGMTRVAFAVGYETSQAGSFPDSAFVPLQGNTVTLDGPSASDGYDGMLRVWVQFANDTGSRSDLLEQTVQAYSYLHIVITDEAGAPFDHLLADASGRSKSLVVQLAMGGYGQYRLPSGSWAVQVTNPQTGEVAQAAVDSSTQKARLTVPGSFLKKPQALKMNIKIGEYSVWHRDLWVDSADGYGIIQMNGAGVPANYAVWVTACNVDTGKVYRRDTTRFPTSVSVPAGTYRVEALVMDEGPDQWAIYPATLVTVKAGQVAQAPVFDTAATVPFNVSNQARDGATALTEIRVQLKPAGVKGPAGLTVSPLPLLNTHVTPGTYDSVVALEKMYGVHDNHVYYFQDRNVDVSKPYTISDDFSDTNHALLTLKGIDGQGAPAQVSIYPYGGYSSGWGSDEVGQTFVHLRKGEYHAGMKVGADAPDAPMFWLNRQFSLQGDLTVTIGGPLAVAFTGDNIGLDKLGSVTTTLTDSFGNRILSASEYLQEISVRDAGGREVDHISTYRFEQIPTYVPADAVLPVRIVSRLDTGAYQGVITSEVVVGAPTFGDIDSVPWAKPAIQLMAWKKIAQGTGGGNFSPMGTVTRAEFATFLVRALSLAPEASSSRFTDVKAADWFDGFVGAAAKAGLTRETSGAFRPKDFITRQEMADMMARALTYKGKAVSMTNLQVDSIFAGFTDANQVADWAREGVAGAAQAGLLKGKNGGRIAPLENATRAEAAVILERLLDYTGDL